MKDPQKKWEAPSIVYFAGMDDRRHPEKQSLFVGIICVADSI